MFKDKIDTHQEIQGNNNQQAQGNINNNFHIHSASERLLTRLPSLMSAAALRLAATIQSTPPPPTKTPYPYAINQKIEYNAVRGYRKWIDDYGTYGYAVDAAYNAVDECTPGAKTRILRNIWTKYTDIRAQLIQNHIKPIATQADEILIIQKHADNIIHIVSQKILHEIEHSPEQGLFVEDLNFSANAITCHAFINCHILDRPPS